MSGTVNYLKTTYRSGIDEALTQAKDSGKFDEVYIGSDLIPESAKIIVDPQGEVIEIPTMLSEMGEDAQHRTVTDNEKQDWNKKLKAFGYQPNKYLGTDSSGNVVEMDAPGSSSKWTLLGDVTVTEQVSQILIDVDKDYDEFQFYVWAKDRVNNTVTNLIISLGEFTSTVFALAYQSIGTSKNFYIKGKSERHVNSGWLTYALAGAAGSPLSTNCGKAVSYYSSSAGSTEHPTKINAYLQTGFDVGSRFVVYAR